MIKSLKLLIKKKTNNKIGKRIASGAFWSLTGSVFAKFLVLVSGIICAHILSKEEYGQFGIVRSTINLFVTVGSAGMGVTAAKYISEFIASDRKKIPSIFCLTNGFAFITGLIITLLILIFSFDIATYILKSPELAPSLRIGALLLFVTIINGAQNGTLAGLENFKAIAINTLYGSIAESVFMLIGAYYWGVFGAVFGFGLGYIVILLANAVSIRKSFRSINIIIEKFRISREHISLLYKFSLPAALASCITAPTFFIVRAMLTRFASFEELAIYEVADQWRIIIMFIPASISQIVLPILSSISSSKNDTYWKVFKINILINVAVAAIVTLFVSLFSEKIMSLYGENYTQNQSTLIILSLSTIFSAICNVVGAALQSKAKTWVGFSFNAVWAVLIISISYACLIKGYGASSISIAFFLSYIVLALGQILFLKYVLATKK